MAPSSHGALREQGHDCGTVGLAGPLGRQGVDRRHLLGQAMRGEYAAEPVPNVGAGGWGGRVGDDEG